MYVAQTSFVDPMFFHLAAETNLVTGAIAGGEKTSFAWVALSDLLAAVGEARKVYFLARDARQRAIEGALYPGAMQLHPCFATTMRLAMVGSHRGPTAASCCDSKSFAALKYSAHLWDSSYAVSVLLEHFIPVINLCCLC